MGYISNYLSKCDIKICCGLHKYGNFKRGTSQNFTTIKHEQNKDII